MNSCQVILGHLSCSFGILLIPSDLFAQTDLRLFCSSYGILSCVNVLIGTLLFSKGSVAELSNCGKLLKARRGVVAERLNAAVC